jgi:hypothetical protein
LSSKQLRHITDLRAAAAVPEWNTWPPRILLARAATRVHAEENRVCFESAREVQNPIISDGVWTYSLAL